MPTTPRAAALHSGDPAFVDLPEYIMGRLEPAADSLLTAARDTGALRATITARELVLVVALMCQPVRAELISYDKRMINVFLRGLQRDP